MAFLLALGGGVVLTYLWTSVSDAYDTVTKPISDYFTKIEQNSLENDKELRLQDHINKLKTTKAKYNEIRSSFNIPIKNTESKIINNTTDICNISYISKTRVNNAEEAINLVKSESQFDLFGISAPKTIKMDPNSDITIIAEEIKFYYIIVNYDTIYCVIDDNDYVKQNIELKDKLHSTFYR